jgi:Flp pilus assembly CpaE family ATPase
LADLRDAIPGVTPTVVVNRVRRGVVGPRPEEEIATALERYVGVTDVVFLPYDRQGLDAAVAAGRTLAEVAPGSSLRAALRGLAGRLSGVPASTQRRRLLMWGS